MADDEVLLGFVQSALSRGVSRQEIEQVLLTAGWGGDHVASALAAFADVDFVVPVPVPKSNVSARDTFLYLALFATLYISAFYFGQLIFGFINRALPEAALDEAGTEQIRASIRWSIAWLIIAFPVFLYVSRLVGRAIQQDGTKRASKVRKWTTYVTLFIAGAVLLGDLSTMVYNFLAGEFSLRFILKVLTVGAIAGTVFGFYLRDYRADEG